MSGLDNIVQQIMEDSSKKAEEIIAEANKKADVIIEDAKTEAGKFKKESDRKIEVLKKTKSQTAQSSSELKKNQAILKAKQEMINDVLKKSEEEILGLPDEEYFDYLLKLLKKSAQPKDGEICLSLKDLSRMPADFSDKAAKIAIENGGKLTVSKEPKNIEGGFILIYGGIEENCSISAVFRDEKEKLVDLLNSTLFS